MKLGVFGVLWCVGVAWGVVGGVVWGGCSWGCSWGFEVFWWFGGFWGVFGGLEFGVLGFGVFGFLGFWELCGFRVHRACIGLVGCGVEDAGCKGSKR